MLHLRGVLSADQLQEVRGLLTDAAWVDGRATAGHQSAKVKDNRQAAEDDPSALRAAEVILQALEGHATFISAALPSRIAPPLFNRYARGQTYGPHIDGAVRPTGPVTRMRTDLSATLFLSDPEDYDGGELRIRGRDGDQAVKLPAGDLVLYDSASVHHVTPVTRGVRVASFFWVQSLVRGADQRRMLFDLDASIQAAAAKLGDDPTVVELTGHYHNLLRLWAEV
jgi:PKHD-type hydroxylase